MIFIFGLKDRQKEISSGSFQCPNCGVTRNYKLKQAGQYFSLYFIPIFRTKDLGEFVECQHCQRIYKPEVLRYKGPTASERLAGTVRSELASGIPLHMMIQKLQSQGIDAATAEQLVQKAVLTGKITCNQCGFEYIAGVQHCFNCGTTLN